VASLHLQLFLNHRDPRGEAAIEEEVVDFGFTAAGVPAPSQTVHVVNRHARSPVLCFALLQMRPVNRSGRARRTQGKMVCTWDIRESSAFSVTPISQDIPAGLLRPLLPEPLLLTLALCANARRRHFRGVSRGLPARTGGQLFPPAPGGVLLLQM
jgi:hypothetical protein